MKYPSLFRVIQIDYYAYMSVLLPGGFWLIMVFMTTIQAANLDRATYVGIILTIFGLIALAWRYMQAARLLSSGKEVTGTIQRTWFFRDRARITCVYTFKGQKYQASQPARLNRRMMALKIGDRVRLVLDEKNPRRFLIRQLFE